MPVDRFEVIELGDPRWSETVRGSEAGVFYDGDFCRLFAGDGLAQPVMLLYRDELGTVFDVTERKQVGSLPFYKRESLGLDRDPVDLSCRMYNGPVTVPSSAGPQLLQRYRQALSAFCQENCVVTEFIRVHPFCPARLALGELEPLTPVSELVYVDLRAGLEEIRRGYRKGHVSTIRKAEREGAAMYIVEPDAEHVERFIRLYQTTMTRKGVRTVYVHPPKFFSSLFECMAGRVWLVESCVRDAVAASSIFLADGDYLWYQYSASDSNLQDTGAHTLAIDRVIEWAAAKDYARLVLGGGSGPYNPEDPVYRFKRGFSRRTATVYQLRRVHSEPLLDALLAAKADYNRDLGRPVQTDWFPSYWLD